MDIPSNRINNDISQGGFSDIISCGQYSWICKWILHTHWKPSLGVGLVIITFRGLTKAENALASSHGAPDGNPIPLQLTH